MIDLDYISEPSLAFGFDQNAEYPRDGLLLFGPVQDHRVLRDVRFGVIGTAEGIQRLERWAASVHGPIERFRPPYNPQAQHHVSFPGFEAVFRARWAGRPAARIEIAEKPLRQALSIGNRHEAVKKAVDLFVEPLVLHANREEIQPECWFVVIPEFVHTQGRPQYKVPKGERSGGDISISVSRARRLQKEPSLFDFEEEEAGIYRYAINFRRQLKARLLAHKIVTQIVRETTLTPGDFLNEKGYPLRKVEDPATIAWKLCTTAYYKTVGNPWRLANVRPGVCYVGLVYKSTDPMGGSANACCAAQMFLASGDGIVFRGAAGPWYTPSTKEYHLSREAAAELMSLVVSEYRRGHNGVAPSELFIHGRARFADEEWEGFSSVVPAETNLVGVQIRDARSELKLFREGRYPVMRGTVLKLSPHSAFLWTSGFVPRLGTYIGPETPNPVLVTKQKGDCDLATVLRDVMGLTKINFNTCQFNDRLPVTIRFANAIGEILIAAPMTDEPKLPFKFYI